MMVAALQTVAQTLEQLGHRCEPVSLDIGLPWEAFVALNAALWAANTSAWLQACRWTLRVFSCSVAEPLAQTARRLRCARTAPLSSALASARSIVASRKPSLLPQS